MSLLARLQITVGSTIAIALVGLIFGELQGLFSKAKSGGQYSGFMSSLVTDLQTVFPLVLVLLLLGVVVWFIIATVQSERAEKNVAPRRPR